MPVPSGAVITGVDMPKTADISVAIGCDCCSRFKMAGTGGSSPYPTGKNFGFDKRLVEYLVKNDIKTTFFLTGKWMKDHPDQTKRLMQTEGSDGKPLFEIGNHGWGHQSIRLLNERGQEEWLDKEVTTTEQQYQIYRDELKAQGKNVPAMAKLFRPPYGDFDAGSVARLQAKHGYQVVNWGEAIDAEKAPRVAVGDKSVRSGSIYLMHAPSDVNGKGIYGGDIAQLESLQRSGVRFQKIGELLKTPGAAPRYSEQAEAANLKVGDQIGGRFYDAAGREPDYFNATRQAAGAEPAVEPAAAARPAAAPKRPGSIFREPAPF